MTEETAELRIGELSRRTGVAPQTLRAWEARYGVVTPQRSPGGYRLYSAADELRIRAMQSSLEAGLSPAEAARRLRAEPRGEPVRSDELVTSLADALAAYDATGAEAQLDRLFATYDLETVLCGALLPYLHELGEQWACGEVTVAQEHFASSVVEGRLLSLARGWDRGVGPAAILASAPGEDHVLGLLSFGLLLRARGWRIVYFGANAPIDSVIDAARTIAPSAVVVSAVTAPRFTAQTDNFRALGEIARLGIGGAGAGADVAAHVGAEALPEDPVAAADALIQRAA
jgi:DNA-binding transcriptional MerR regulator